MENNSFRPGNYQGFIAGAKLGISMNKEIPFIQINWHIIDLKENVNQTLWLSEEVIDRGFNEGKQQCEVTVETLENLGYKGKKLSDMEDHAVEDLFDTNKSFNLEVDYQRKNGAPTQYKTVKWVVFSGSRKIDQEKVVNVFSKFDSLLKINNNKEENFKNQDIPF